MRLILRMAWTHIVSRRRQTIVSLIGVALGVGFYIGIRTLMGGFQKYFVAKIIDVSPHITIRDEYRTAPLQAVNLFYDNAAVELHGAKPKEEIRGIKRGMQILRE